MIESPPSASSGNFVVPSMWLRKWYRFSAYCLVNFVICIQQWWSLPLVSAESMKKEEWRTDGYQTHQAYLIFRTHCFHRNRRKMKRFKRKKIILACFLAGEKSPSRFVDSWAQSRDWDSSACWAADVERDTLPFTFRIIMFNPEKRYPHLSSDQVSKILQRLVSEVRSSLVNAILRSPHGFAKARNGPEDENCNAS